MNILDLCTEDGDIVIREGAPPQRPPARAGHFLDRAS